MAETTNTEQTPFIDKIIGEQGIKFEIGFSMADMLYMGGIILVAVVIAGVLIHLITKNI